MKLFKDERAETPYEVGAYVLLCLLVMAFLMTTVGALIDSFTQQINLLLVSMPLQNASMQTMMTTYLGYGAWAFRIPAIFIIIVLIWGVRAVIRKHTYTTDVNGQQIMNPDEEF